MQISTLSSPLKVINPEAYKYTWDREISTVPRSFLTTHAAAMADLNKSILTPVPRRTWIDDEKTIDKMRIIKSVHEITKEQLPSQTNNSTSTTTTTTNEPVEKRTLKRKADKLFPLPIPGTPDAFDRTLLILNVEQMKKENVPLPNELLIDQRKYFKNRSDFVPSKPVYLPVSANSPMYAVDCEMVLTSVGSELARVTMVDEKATVMFDRLVKPPNPVKDYLTKFSGITREMLALIDTTLADIQRELAETLPGDAILVGHSIGNDLEAMKADIGFGDVTTSWRFPEDYQSPIETKSARFTALTSNKQNSNISGCLQQYDNTTNDNNLPFISSTCNGLLTESQYFETHPVFQDHLLKLCSFYKSLGKPIHLFNRLLHDSGVTYAYWPIYQGENDKEQQQQQREEQEREKESVQHITTDSKHSEIFIPINFNSTDHQTTTTDNVNTTTTTATTTTTNSDEPTTTLTKCYHKVCKFCTKLYSNLAENSLIGVICTGSEFQKPLSKKRTHANILKSALGNFYITLNSNVVVQTTTVDNDSK
ncbi:RNA exonuclease 1 [Schistosoma bovis]|uniref:RNA exonuclease 1 n=1 Tax=Schistosoma bovis TaxID=6184 RepID=A0A430Q8W2_SCHBO|nr:RNA exonuclease 1 [Schistosoma bovis]